MADGSSTFRLPGLRKQPHDNHGRYNTRRHRLSRLWKTEQMQPRSGRTGKQMAKKSEACPNCGRPVSIGATIKIPPRPGEAHDGYPIRVKRFQTRACACGWQGQCWSWQSEDLAETDDNFRG